MIERVEMIGLCNGSGWNLKEENKLLLFSTQTFQ